MFSSIFAVSFLAALAPQALATLYITAPVATTTCQAGQPCAVSWDDDGTQPTLSQIGACTVALYVGSQTTQIQLQALGNVDVSTQATASFVPDASVGGNSPLYFLRFTSTVLNEGAYPWEGFSAKFTLSGMTGTFNATEQSLMTAPTSAIGSSTPAASTTSSGSAPASTSTGIVTVTSTGSASSTAKPTGSTSSKPASTSTSSTGAAVPVLGSSSHAVALVAVVVSAFFAAAAF